MIALEAAKDIALKQFPGYSVCEIRDMGNEWAFGYDTIVPGIPYVCVSKSNGDIGYLTVPPIENLEILEKGKVIYSID